MYVRDNQGKVSLPCLGMSRTRVFPKESRGRFLMADESVSRNSIEPDINGRAMNATRKGAASRAAPMGLSP